ncbi:ESF2/ABP1 family protein [Trypanosoma rangeli]|uniref:ESF2/ABP1 family protein n=1 Tax=Trypanosoma rangeli TaxID=5698 RepID=A0A3R7N8I1_TRYRA|nr:ESF2/ABP1 family protein [Trypanosoma rangeli]RNF02144.1 ESF2/ABP1 family protein [Trypanosoma rangeli]|eukprot:RNF02144.1 ESF2/ABP1 family protein [Trypanosoma rangeli]
MPSDGGSHDDDYVPPAQRGVVFFSTIPRDMRPQEVRMHFSEFGTILRQRFTPFPKKERRPGGPLLPLQFMNGYLEFAHAADARRAAAAMNGTAVACKRRRKCHGQLWTVKFLDDFTWDTLLEEREGALRTRRQREAEARGTERAINEAYRAAVLATMRRKRPRGEEGAPERKQREPEGPVRAERREGRASARTLRDASASLPPPSAAAAAAATAGDTPLGAVKKRPKRQC